MSTGRWRNAKDGEHSSHSLWVCPQVPRHFQVDGGCGTHGEHALKHTSILATYRFRGPITWLQLKPISGASAFPSRRACRKRRALSSPAALAFIRDAPPKPARPSTSSLSLWKVEQSL